MVTRKNMKIMSSVLSFTVKLWGSNEVQGWNSGEKHSRYMKNGSSMITQINTELLSEIIL